MTDALREAIIAELERQAAEPRNGAPYVDTDTAGRDGCIVVDGWVNLADLVAAIEQAGRRHDDAVDQY